jgi:peptidoglycan LD-endopeptidase CwlK
MPSRALSDLRPVFGAMVVPWLDDWKVQAAGYDTVIACTLRTHAEQAALYAQGRSAPGPIVTKAKPGQSAHEYGLAIDVYPMFHGKLITDEGNPIWQELGNFGQARGLQWYGVPEAPFHEMPHFQHPQWRELIAAELAAAA